MRAPVAVCVMATREAGERGKTEDGRPETGDRDSRHRTQDAGQRDSGSGTTRLREPTRRNGSENCGCNSRSDRGTRLWSPEALLPGTGEACGEGARLLRSLASIREPRFRAQAELAHSRRPTTEGRRRSERRRTEDRRPGIAAYGSMGKASLESGSFASGHRRSLW